MTSVFVGMTTDALGLSASLLASNASSILAFAWSMAWLSTEMRAAFELLATNLATSNILKPALLILHQLLATHASLFNQERTLWTILIILMTVVLDLRVATRLGSVALHATWRRLSTAWERWGKYSPTTMARNLIKDGLTT